MAVEFKHIMLMVTDVSASVKFYHEGLGLEIEMSSPGWAQLNANGTTIALHHAHEARLGGDSPILSFVVDDIAVVMARLEALGAKLEGRVREPSFGKVAAMRSPDGTLLSLLQPAPQPAVTAD